MKTALVLLLTMLACGRLGAQPNNGYSVPQYRTTASGTALDTWLRGRTVTNVEGRIELITDFKMESYRADKKNEVQFIVEAPECYFNGANNTAWDSGRIQLFTPTTNLFVQGDGYFFTEATHVLNLSNNVETRVLRSMLKSPLVSGTSSNAPENPGQMIKIFSHRCLIDNQSNRIDYAGAVHVIDAQTDLRSDFMTVQLTTNNAIKNIHAWQNVVITPTNRGSATGNEAFYYITNDAAMTDLTGNAVWTNGTQQAHADKFIYDSTHRFLVAAGHVQVQWPNATNSPGAEKMRWLFADHATLQLPPTNGPVQRMEALGHVVITNEADASRSTSDRAVYVRTNDNFELTGHPDWQTDKMDVKGNTLTADITNKMYHARGDAHLRLKINSATHPDQWIDVTSVLIDYQTNLAVFRDHVHGLLIESNAVRDTLDCDLLHVTLVSNQVENAIAEGHVRGETAPDLKGAVKTISCQTLTAQRSPQTGLMKTILAEENVVITDFGPPSKNRTNTLTADLVTARFAATTNQLEEAIAENHVVIDQKTPTQKMHATSDRADYVIPDDQVKLTGHPIARTDRYLMTDADDIIWRPKTNQFSADGPFQIVPLSTNRVSKPR